jgi:hypothetical protein
LLQRPFFCSASTQSSSAVTMAQTTPSSPGRFRSR